MARVRMYHAASNRFQYDAAENFEAFHQHEGWVLVDDEPEPEAEDVQTFSTSDMPGPDADWTVWRKKVPTRMVRIEGPFVVQTSEGPLRCADGWLAVDARGYPYPIAADEQELIYEPDIPSDPPPVEPPADDPPADTPAETPKRGRSK